MHMRCDIGWRPKIRLNRNPNRISASLKLRIQSFGHFLTTINFSSPVTPVVPIPVILSFVCCVFAFFVFHNIFPVAWFSTLLFSCCFFGVPFGCLLSHFASFSSFRNFFLCSCASNCILGHFSLNWNYVLSLCCRLSRLYRPCFRLTDTILRCGSGSVNQPIAISPRVFCTRLPSSLEVIHAYHSRFEAFHEQLGIG
jgi:hypothetical protein